MLKNTFPLCSEHVGLPAVSNTRDHGLSGVAKRQETVSCWQICQGEFGIKKIAFTVSEAVPGEVRGDPKRVSLHIHGHRRLS